ncbi:MAG: hypothetical protein M1840_005189 [Geoglossum simile]|nr:MAG: hypothetical protein M1840_005189 [Geoglossum simile]
MSSRQGSFSLGHAVPAAIQVRHQRSLEQILDFEHRPLDAAERLRAEQIFSRILAVSATAIDGSSPFDPVCLLQLSLEKNPSERGKDNFLNYVLRNYDDGPGDDLSVVPFLQVLDRLDGEVTRWLSSPPSWVGERTTELAYYLVHFFFLPFRGQATKTPQPTPHLTPIGDSRRGHTPLLDRISNLRATCLARDSHRCVVSHFFDQATAEGRDPAIDDSGLPLDDDGTISTEVAHIIPHALGEATNEDSPLDSWKATFWDIMKLFNPQAEQLLDGIGIDKPFNAMTLSLDLHRSFGNLKWYFDEEPEPHAYIFKKTPGTRLFLFRVLRPQNQRGRVEFTSATMTDLPDRGLLALHRACALIVGLSGAGEYMDKVLRDSEDIRQGNCERLESGTLNLGALVSWRLALC